MTDHFQPGTASKPPWPACRSYIHQSCRRGRTPSARLSRCNTPSWFPPFLAAVAESIAGRLCFNACELPSRFPPQASSRLGTGLRAASLPGRSSPALPRSRPQAAASASASHRPAEAGCRCCPASRAGPETPLSRWPCRTAAAGPSDSPTTDAAASPLPDPPGAPQVTTPCSGSAPHWLVAIASPVNRWPPRPLLPSQVWSTDRGGRDGGGGCLCEVGLKSQGLPALCPLEI